jgi:hypothetical protein
MSQADSASITNSDLVALSTRLRYRADAVIADRAAATDMRAAGRTCVAVGGNTLRVMAP